MVFRFAGFELDQQRAELRGPDGVAIKLRPKTFEMLRLFAANAGRVLSKQELMEAVWPNVHVGEDNLFQCIREIRTALRDDQRQTIKLVSGRGYLFAVEVLAEPLKVATPAEAALSAPAANVEPLVNAEVAATGARPRWLPLGLRRPAALAAVVGLCAIVGLAVAAPTLRPDLIFKQPPPIIAMMPIVDTSNDHRGATIAAGVTDRLVDGLAKIENIRVVAPRSGTTAGLQAASSAQSDFVLQGELQRDQQSWTFQARIIKTANGEVQSVATASADLNDGDVQFQQTRLAAGAGDTLARRLNALLENGAPPVGHARVVIEQATASINQTSRERFATAQTMLEKFLADEPDNPELQVALAGLQLRGIMMVWYDPAESAAAENNARSWLERAVRAKPRYIPVLEAYCRFLTATNQFVESLVACARALSFDPWNGSALYNIGLSQIRLGRFEDALATFKQADRFDTPEVSRWTWLLGAGWVSLLMGRNEDAVPWLERSVAITPASGRPLMTLAAAYQRVGRTDDAKAAMAKAMELRPGSTALNVPPPTRNASPAYLEASELIMRTMVKAGLPER
jgi:DNA-binding winged helix-turn-helix (wHTH) protein/TolB-like protein/Tfp pilus assembly protein PilF